MSGGNANKVPVGKIENLNINRKMNYFVIKTPGGYVAGYNTQHMVVSTAKSLPYAKRFANERKAEAFLAKYGGEKGYGLESGVVVEVQF